MIFNSHNAIWSAWLHFIHVKVVVTRFAQRFHVCERAVTKVFTIPFMMPANRIRISAPNTLEAISAEALLA